MLHQELVAVGLSRLANKRVKSELVIDVVVKQDRGEQKRVKRWGMNIPQLINLRPISSLPDFPIFFK